MIEVYTVKMICYILIPPARENEVCEKKFSHNTHSIYQALFSGVQSGSSDLSNQPKISES